MSSPERRAITTIVVSLLIVRLLVVGLPVSIVLVWHNVAMIMVRFVRIAVLIAVIMVVIGVDNISTITAIYRCDSVLIIAPFIVSPCT